MAHNHQQQPSLAGLAITDAINAARYNHPLLPLQGIGIRYYGRMPSSELLKLFLEI